MNIVLRTTLSKLSLARTPKAAFHHGALFVECTTIGCWRLHAPTVQQPRAPVVLSASRMVHGGVTWARDVARGVWITTGLGTCGVV